MDNMPEGFKKYWDPFQNQIIYRESNVHLISERDHSFMLEIIYKMAEALEKEEKAYDEAKFGNKNPIKSIMNRFREWK